MTRESHRVTADLPGNPAAFYARLATYLAAGERFAREGNVTVSWERLWQIAPRPFNNGLIAMCDEAIAETCGKSHKLPSGPLHDAAEVAAAGVPTVMMFAPCPTLTALFPAPNWIVLLPVPPTMLLFPSAATMVSLPPCMA